MGLINVLSIDKIAKSLFTILVNPLYRTQVNYKDIQLTTGDPERQLNAARKVDYGPKKK